MKQSPFQQLEEFFTQFNRRHYKKGATILHAGDTPAGVFYLTKGYAKLYSLSRRGEEFTLVIYKPGDFFPMTWAVSNTPTEYAIDAMTPINVWRAPQDQFQEFIKNNPSVLFELTGRILTRMGGLVDRMEHFVFGNAYVKVASILYICAERFGKKKGRSIVIQLPLTHKDIASLIGLTRETTSIKMKNLEKKKLIGRKGKTIVVRNFARLKEEALLKDVL